MHFRERLALIFPFLQWWPMLNRTTLKADTLAGLTGAIVVLPQGVAFAIIAGMPPEYGLYAAMVPAIVAALFGSSWHLISGPTTAASLVLFASLSTLAEPGSPEYIRLAITLTFLVGMVQVIMGLVKLGSLVNFISHSVIIGFTAGAAILIAANQLKTFLGLEMPRGLHLHEIVLNVFSQRDAINPYVVLVGSVTLLSGILARRYLRPIPYMVLALLIGSLLGTALNVWLGAAHTGISTVGALPAGLPPLSAPDLNLNTLKTLAPAVLALSLLALTEAVSISRSIALRSGQHVSGNQEFIGQGLSNLAGSFFSAYVATGSFNRSGLNYEAGARTPLAAIIAGLALIGLVMLLAPVAAYLPHAAMAGVLFLVAWGLLDFHHIHQVMRTSLPETAVMGTTFAATLLLDLEFAILLGVFLSLVVYLSRTSRPRMITRVPNPHSPQRSFITDPALPECPQLKILRIDGSLFFGAVHHVRENLMRMLRIEPGQKHLLLVASGINFIDVAGAEFLAAQAKTRREEGGGLYLYRVKEGVLEPLQKGGYMALIGPENLFISKHRALATIHSRLDPEVCKRCTRRIFQECHAAALTPPP